MNISWKALGEAISKIDGGCNGCISGFCNDLFKLNVFDHAQMETLATQVEIYGKPTKWNREKEELEYEY